MPDDPEEPPGDGDLDDDGIPDDTEGGGDTDGDDVPDYLDEDSDDDGIPDADEGAGDTDNDGVPDFQDPDSDGDSVPDADEGDGDSDGDGVPDYLDLDSDGDGIPDAIEGDGDGDGDGIPAYLDDDSDDDGVSDADSDPSADADSDGIPDFLDLDDTDGGDTDSDGDGLSDAEEVAAGSDPFDPDSDGDGVPDGEDDVHDSLPSGDVGPSPIPIDDLPWGAAPFATLNPWSSPDLRYCYVNQSPDLSAAAQLAAFEQAFLLWSSVSSLTFEETACGSAEIQVSFAVGAHGDGAANDFDGPLGVLAHAFYPGPSSLAGDMHMDDDEAWSDDFTGIDLPSVAVHELGHALGLRHSGVIGAVMYTFYSGPKRALNADDIAGIQALYGTTGDMDGDGYGSPGDCDDQNPSVHPGATELCDDIDNDCDGEVDEDVAFNWYLDGDGDGYGDPDSSDAACASPADHVSNGADCDDNDSSIHPGATEVCDFVDNDCDMVINENLGQVWYADNDGDGYGNPNQTMNLCQEYGGWVAEAGDCDDGDDDVNPGVDEVCMDFED